MEQFEPRILDSDLLHRKQTIPRKWLIHVAPDKFISNTVTYHNDLQEAGVFGDLSMGSSGNVILIQSKPLSIEGGTQSLTQFKSSFNGRRDSSINKALHV